MKEEFYLRVEGVNLANFVYDTLDLSTTRGGGLLLLDAIKKVENCIKESSLVKSLQPVSTGASNGLFSFSVENPKEADELRKKVIKFLTKDEQLRHATFVVDILPVGEDFNQDKETLLAMNRWQQMQSPTVVFPSPLPRETESNGCCGIDYLRPAVRVDKVKATAIAIDFKMAIESMESEHAVKEHSWITRWNNLALFLVVLISTAVYVHYYGKEITGDVLNKVALVSLLVFVFTMIDVFILKFYQIHKRPF